MDNLFRSNKIQTINFITYLALFVCFFVSSLCQPAGNIPFVLLICAVCCLIYTILSFAFAKKFKYRVSQIFNTLSIFTVTCYLMCLITMYPPIMATYTIELIIHIFICIAAFIILILNILVNNGSVITQGRAMRAEKVFTIIFSILSLISGLYLFICGCIFGFSIYLIITVFAYFSFIPLFLLYASLENQMIN